MYGYLKRPTIFFIFTFIVPFETKKLNFRHRLSNIDSDLDWCIFRCCRFRYLSNLVLNSLSSSWIWLLYDLDCQLNIPIIYSDPNLFYAFRFLSSSLFFRSLAKYTDNNTFSQTTGHLPSIVFPCQLNDCWTICWHF